MGGIQQGELDLGCSRSSPRAASAGPFWALVSPQTAAASALPAKTLRAAPADGAKANPISQEGQTGHTSPEHGGVPPAQVSVRAEPAELHPPSALGLLLTP